MSKFQGKAEALHRKLTDVKAQKAEGSAECADMLKRALAQVDMLESAAFSEEASSERREMDVIEAIEKASIPLKADLRLKVDELSFVRKQLAAAEALRVECETGASVALASVQTKQKELMVASADTVAALTSQSEACAKAALELEDQLAATWTSETSATVVEDQDRSPSHSSVELGALRAQLYSACTSPAGSKVLSAALNESEGSAGANAARIGSLQAELSAVREQAETEKILLQAQLNESESEWKEKYAAANKKIGAMRLAQMSKPSVSPAADCAAPAPSNELSALQKKLDDLDAECSAAKTASAAEVRLLQAELSTVSEHAAKQEILHELKLNQTESEWKEKYAAANKKIGAMRLAQMSKSSASPVAAAVASPTEEVLALKKQLADLNSACATAKETGTFELSALQAELSAAREQAKNENSLLQVKLNEAEAEWKDKYAAANKKIGALRLAQMSKPSAPADAPPAGSKKEVSALTKELADLQVECTAAKAAAEDQISALHAELILRAGTVDKGA